MIKELRIYNFRSIKELILNPTQLSAILGPNSAWKSNVLKAIDLVLGEWWTTKWSVKRELFFNPQDPLKIEIYFNNAIPYDYYWSEKSIHCASVVMSCHGTSFSCENRLWINSYDDGISWASDKKWFYLNEEFKQKCSFIYIPSQRDLVDQMRVSSWTMLWKIMSQIYQNYCDSYGIKSDWSKFDRTKWETELKTAFKESMVSAKDFLEKDFAENNLTFSQFKKKFVENCKKNSLWLANDFTPELDIYDVNWFYKTLQISVSEEWNEKQFNALEIGSWMQNLLLLSIFQTYAELMWNTVIFGIEEPELFLYPHAQRGLYKTFRKLSENSQILYTTHNPAFLDASKPEEIIMLRKKKNGTEQIEKENFSMRITDEMRIYTHFNMERNEIFFANRVVLVEWPSEKIILTNLCEQNWIDIETLGVSIIECSSKTGVLYFIGVCRLSGLDYFAIWDTDIKKWKDAEVTDSHWNLKFTLESWRGLEMDDDLENEIIRLGYTDYKNVGGDDKVLNAYNWSISGKLKGVPGKFEHIFAFIKDGTLIEDKKKTDEIIIEDIPF